ncbi:MAG: hypothetical protein SFT92_01895 [Rickettsiales bacterium]|nr:hypothetical protein [Rickettsiales bacterium]
MACIYSLTIGLVFLWGYFAIYRAYLAPNPHASDPLLPITERLKAGRFDGPSAFEIALKQTIESTSHDPAIAADKRAFVKQRLEQLFQACAQMAYGPSQPIYNSLQLLMGGYLLYVSPHIESSQLLDIAESMRDTLNKQQRLLFPVIKGSIMHRKTLLSQTLLSPYLARAHQVAMQWLQIPDLIELLSYRQPINPGREVSYQRKLYDGSELYTLYRLLRPTWVALREDLQNIVFSSPDIIQRYQDDVKRYQTQYHLFLQEAQEMALLDYNFKYNRKFLSVSPLTALHFYNQLAPLDRNSLHFYDFLMISQILVNLAYVTHASEYGRYPDFQVYLKERFFPTIFKTAREAGINPLHLLMELRISAHNSGPLTAYNEDIKQTHNQLLFTLAARAFEDIAPELPLRDWVYYLVTAKLKGGWVESMVAVLRVNLIGRKLMYGLDHVTLYEFLRIELPTYTLRDIESEVVAPGILFKKAWFDSTITAEAQRMQDRMDEAEKKRQVVQALTEDYIANYGDSLDVFLDPSLSDALIDAAWTLIDYPKDHLAMDKLTRYSMIWRNAALRYSVTINANVDAKSLYDAYLLARGDTIRQLQTRYDYYPDESRTQFLGNQLDNPNFFTAITKPDWTGELYQEAAVSLTSQPLMPGSWKQITMLGERIAAQQKQLTQDARNKLQALSAAMVELKATKEKTFFEGLSVYARLTEHNRERDLELQMKLAASWHAMMENYTRQAFKERAKKIGVPLPDDKNPKTLRMYMIGVVANREVAVMESLTNEHNYPRLAHGMDAPYNVPETTYWLMELWEAMIHEGLLPKGREYDFDLFYGYMKLLEHHHNYPTAFLTTKQYKRLEPIFRQLRSITYSSMHRDLETIFLFWNTSAIPLARDTLSNSYDVNVSKRFLDELQYKRRHY